MKKFIIPAIAFSVLAINIQPVRAEVDAAHIFKTKCAMCHALSKKKFGPPFAQMNTDSKVLKMTITNGRKSMPKFNSKLSAAEIDAMVSYIQSTHAK